jgi:hypothetical protein
MEMLRPSPDFKKNIYGAFPSMDALAERSGVNRSTLFAWLSPKTRRKTGIRLNLAWDVARAYARVEGISKEEAFERLFVEVEEAAGEPA